MVGLTTIVLAAGEGTRMRSSTPKLLHEVAGLPIVGHVVRAASEAGSERICAITGPGADEIRTAIREVAPGTEFFEQTERLGTAHAALQGRSAFEAGDGYVAIVYGDHPLLTGDIFKKVSERLDHGWDAAILGFEPDDPTGYGRLITEGERLLDIREHKDASLEERNIGLCNACILAFRAPILRELIARVGNDNAQGEYYLGDLVPLANAAGYRVTFTIAPAHDVVGVNDRAQLAFAEKLYQTRLRAKAMLGGATLVDPSSTYFSHDTEIGQDVTIEPGVYIGRNVKIGDGVRIFANSHIEGATVGKGASVGPFARLRPGTVLEEGAKVGNYCEVKKAVIGAGAKVNHLSYIGDATVGPRANIGAGTITCNYDGVNKHRTEIGADAFIGSNSALVAPVRIGAGAIVAAGSTITHDVADNDLAVARTRQENKTGMAETIRRRIAGTDRESH